MVQVYIAGVFMNFFDLLFPNKRKQKEVDRFFLHSLAAHSGEYKDVLTAAFEKIKKLSHTNSLWGGKELMISYSAGSSITIEEWTTSMAMSPSCATYRSLKYGSSCLQGVQEVAHRLMKTIFPRWSARWNSEPS